MIVISDSSPINYLVLINKGEVLQQLYGRVIIPPAVHTELQRERTPSVVRQWIRHKPEWLEVHPATITVDSELDDLGTGEREAILLAEQLKADALLIDDRYARRAAKRRHLAVIGTLQILDTAADHGLLDMSAALDELQRTNFRVASTLLQMYHDRDVMRRKQRESP